MYRYNIIVRWCSTGEYEGFSASALTEREAFLRACRKVEAKASHFIESGFDLLSEREFNALPIDLQNEIKKEWKDSEL